MTDGQAVGGDQSSEEIPAGESAHSVEDGSPAEKGKSAGSDAQADGNTTEQQTTTAREEALNYESHASEIRIDFATGGTYRDVAGVINNHYYTSGTLRGTSVGRVRVTKLEQVLAAHVETPSDEGLRSRLQAQHVVILLGAAGTGRGESALVALDELTGQSREVSRVVMLDAAGGLRAALGQFQPEHGHVLDASEAAWADTISEAQINQAREVLGDHGFLVIVADSDNMQIPGHVVEHAHPDLEQVAAFQLAVRLVGGESPDPRTLADARGRAHAIIAEARADAGTRQWHEEITGPTIVSPSEAVMFADAIWDWHGSKTGDSSAIPRVEKFRFRRYYDEARTQLRHRGGMSSPVSQAYMISAAVLDGLALNEVVEGATELSRRFAQVESSNREIFVQPLARWIRPAEIEVLGIGKGTVVRMPSRGLARSIVEAAWREYDCVRAPMLDWLLALCEEHPDELVRVRAVQTLAYIATDDYKVIEKKVLERWAESRSPERHVTASWLLEAIVRDGASSKSVLRLLRNWSRESDYKKRAIALRAYGTSIAQEASGDAIAAVRFSADMNQFSYLPELALREMYRLGMVTEVMAELTSWPRSLPAARRRASRALVRIAYIRGNLQDGSEGSYHLLWLLSHDPDQVGASLTQITRLWQSACLDEQSAKDAWRVLCDWASSCAGDAEMSRTFITLADEFEKTAQDAKLRSRIGMYRRWWDRHLTEETRK
jgi:hypothetical protein